VKASDECKTMTFDFIINVSHPHGIMW
jgi:hypothetical protein